MPTDRDATQAKMDQLAAGTMRHTPSQQYTVADRLEEKAAAHPDKAFLFFEDRRLSYADVNTQANRIAHAAAEAGLATGDVVALMMENRPEFLTTWMGLAKLGVVTALINTNVRGTALQHAIEATGAKHVVAGVECLEPLATISSEKGNLSGALTPALSRGSAGEWESVPPASEGRIYVLRDPARPTTPERLPAGAIDLDDILARMPTDNPDPGVRSQLAAGDDLFYVFTSGTTGLPKAARLSHMRYLGVGDGMSAIAGYGPDDVIACVLPLYHGAGGMVVISCALAQGAAVALRRKFSASRFWDEARAYGVTAFQYIGEICRYLLNRPETPDDRNHEIRVMMGAGLGRDIWEKFQQRFGVEHILEGWSSTEANTSLINLDNRVGSCGRIPFKERHNGRLIRYDTETDTHPRDDNGFCTECDPGEVGEFIGMILNLPDSGAGRFEGYTSPDETEAKILHDVFQKGDRWYRSGDLLYRDAEDYFYFVDRVGDTFRWKSENVSTQEVAEALSGFPGVEIANVYGVNVPDAEGRAGMAALVLRDPQAFDGKSLFDFTQEHLPSYAAPMFVRLVREADMTSTFKLRKVDLQRDGYDLDRVRDPVYVRDEAARSYVRLTSKTAPS